MLQLLHSLEELGCQDVADNSFGVLVPIEDLGVGFGVPDGIFSIDIVIFQLQVGSTRSVDSGTLGDLDNFLNWGAAFLGVHYFLVGVDQVVVIFHPEDSFIGRLDLEIAVPGSHFGVFDVEGSEAGFSEVGFQDLPPLTVVHTAQFEALTEFGGSQHLILLLLLEGQNVVMSWAWTDNKESAFSKDWCCFTRQGNIHFITLLVLVKTFHTHYWLRINSKIQFNIVTSRVLLQIPSELLSPSPLLNPSHIFRGTFQFICIILLQKRAYWTVQTLGPYVEGPLTLGGGVWNQNIVLTLSGGVHISLLSFSSYNKGRGPGSFVHYVYEARMSLHLCLSNGKRTGQSVG